MAFFAPLVAGLSSLFTPAAVTAGAKSVLGSMAGGAVNRFFDNKKQSDSFDYLSSKGLTPQEIAGSGAVGQGATSVGNVLGNQSAELERINRQQAYDERQRNLDRQIAMRGQDTSLAAAKTAAGASIYSSDTSGRIADMNNALARDTYENVTLPQALREAVTNSPGWKRLQILAGMGVDNMIGTAIGNKYGLDPMDPDALRGMSDSDFRKMVTEIYGLQSNVFGESAGAATVIGNGLGEAVDAGRRVLGR